MITFKTLTQLELERLLKESKDIANNWDTYSQFQHNRTAVLGKLLAEQGVN